MAALVLALVVLALALEVLALALALALALTVKALALPFNGLERQGQGKQSECQAVVYSLPDIYIFYLPRYRHSLYR